MTPSDSAVQFASETGELNLAIFKGALAYVEKHHGREGLEDLAKISGLPIERLLTPKSWVLHGEVESLLRALRALLGSDAKFREAFAYDVVESLGPLLLVFRASTVLTSYRVLAKTTHFASRVSRYEVLDARGRSVTLRYVSTKPESRLMCLSRQAMLPTLPTIFWGLAPARLTEAKCIARGDDCCEYHLQWSEPLAWRWPLAGLALGFAVSSLAAFLSPTHGLAFPWPGHGSLALPLVGALLGSTIAFRKMVVQARDFHSETTERVGTLVRDHQGAVEQVMQLHARQEAYNALLAERIEARTATLQAMVRELRSTRERSEQALKGLSHDIRNPLQVVKLNAQVLSEHSDKEVVEVAEQIMQSANRMEAQMRRLLEIASSHADAFELNAERIAVAPLVERVRKNLQALVIARDIRVSVFRTRESPETIETDGLLFDRVVDNILSNAVKYTERGSIIVEVGGAPGTFTIKVSDTGRGISKERLEKVFIGGQRDATPLLGESHGIGLANTVRLLDELGGRLEVMSKPQVGTTIWAHLPLTPPRRSGTLRVADSQEQLLSRVVTIRAAANE